MIQDRSAEYSRAKAGDQINVPADLNDFKINSRYPVAPIEYESRIEKDFELPKPPNMTATQDGEPYTIENADGQQWLSIYMAPGRVWPLIDFFLSDNVISVESEVINEGTLKTGIIESASPLLKSLDQEKKSELSGNKMSITLRQGVRRKTSEIVVDVTDKHSRSLNNRQLETKLLNLLGKFVTSDEQQNRQSLLANDIASEPKVFLINNEDNPYLKFILSYERTWIEVGKALESSGVVVSDVNRTKGSYFVSYLNEDSLDSWYRTESSVAERRKEKNFLVSLEKPADKENDGLVVTVTVLNDKLDATKAIELLELIFEHVS